MICQHCHKSPATVHVTEVLEPPPTEEGGQDEEQPQIIERHLCELCAQTADLPHSPVQAEKKTMADIWKLLQVSAQQGKQVPEVTCAECGMTLTEFRQKGRLGCPEDYDLFAPHVGELLERIHGSRQHVGRLPGISESDLTRLRKLEGLRMDLEAVIREEDYENAARLRDEIRNLEVPAGGETPDTD
ncbi:MAG TPA: UvrB/UvrC motif-containing protein [Planctomycetota bacterium]|nr:UvrB/UvrC motif-containing protein [Planctomycetota bacterium]